MTNKEWLEKVKKDDDGTIAETIAKARKSLFADEGAISEFIMNYRKLKALEIIAEELIEFKEIINFALLHHSFMGLRKELVEAFGEEEVKKAEKPNEEKTKI